MEDLNKDLFLYENEVSSDRDDEPETCLEEDEEEEEDVDDELPEEDEY